MGLTRANRVADQIKQEVAAILALKVRDPRIGFVTVTDVKVTQDLHHAKIFVSVQEKQDAPLTFAALKKASSFVRGQLAQSLPLRRVPGIAFFPDNENESQILNLLDEVEYEENRLQASHHENNQDLNEGLS